MAQPNTKIRHTLSQVTADTLHLFISGENECAYCYILSLLPQSVDYKGMSANPVFERYAELAIQLQRVELLSLSREEKLAFFINIYNALVIHGYLRLGAPTNMWQRYRVGSHNCTSQKLHIPEPDHVQQSL